MSKQIQTDGPNMHLVVLESYLHFNDIVLQEESTKIFGWDNNPEDSSKTPFFYID